MTQVPKEQLEYLIKLQEFDSKKLMLAKKKDTYPLLLKQYAEPVDKSKKELEKADIKLKDAEKEKRAKESELKLQNDKLEKMMSRVTDLKTNKEYETHKHEVQKAKDNISAVEEDILRIMDAMDKLQVIKKDRQVQFEANEKEYNNKKLEVESELKTIENDLKKMDEGYKKVEKLVPADILKEYDDTKLKRRGIGLVSIDNHTCLGCNLTLTPQLVAEVKKGLKVQRCPHCQRLLYWKS